MSTVERTGAHIEVLGTVQGVGFRPFVYRLAGSLGLAGTVRNDGGQVLIDVSGTPGTVADFLRRLPLEAPPQSRVREVRVRAASPDAVPAGFLVLPSTPGSGTGSSGSARDIPPDLAVCGPCLRELFDPADRRYRYPFLNCTDCGPRASVIAALPYDRTRTAMAGFPLCPACAGEYADPGSRRFAAEPLACPACGPQLRWSGPAGSARAADALAAAEEAVRAGAIVALKGLGGYQLVADAADADAVARLRARKHRPTKPFAVMAADLAGVREIAELDQAEQVLLESVARPVVLLRRRPGAPLAPQVHPGLTEVGVFLPTTPLHHLLLADLCRPLVVTSGNVSAEPIRIDDADARARLGGIAEGFLSHDRPILARYDDSVARVVAGRPMVLRRARGYAPAPVPLPIPAAEPVLAVGAELKATFAIASGRRAVLGPHVGDLEDAETMDAYLGNLAHLRRIEGLGAATPTVVAHDLHPGYLSTQHAARLPATRRIGVQHHHAHVASCAAEHGLTERFLGVAYDGLGLGEDGTLWGGEVLVADLCAYSRYARFSRAPLPGGAAAVRHPTRMALGYLLGGEDLGGPEPPAELGAALLAGMAAAEAALLPVMLARGINSPQASSAGRLFDAAASLLGLVEGPVSYEGEAAIALEHRALPGPAEPLAWRLVRRDGLWVYDGVATLVALAAARAAGEPVPALAARFCATLAAVTVALVTEAAADTGLDLVCLSGGVWQNRRLLAAVLDQLSAEGLSVFVNQTVPVNDGGISYGQAAVAAARLAKE